jgi:protein-disulfide isomerase
VTLVRTLLAVAIAALAVVAAGCGGDDSKSSSTPAATTEATTEPATTETTPGADLQDPAADISGIPQSGVTLGEPDAPVTLYEFADLQCPFCREFSNEAFPQIVDEYVRTGQIKVVFRSLTFIGPDSVTAARAAAAAGLQDKLWDFVDVFYANQGPENSGYVTEAFIEQIAGKAGADPVKLKQDLDDPAVERQLAEAQQQAQESGVNSTPAFLVQIGSGRPKPLANQTAEFSEISEKLDLALSKAK